jgi:hypothetical protein
MLRHVASYAPHLSDQPSPTPLPTPYVGPLPLTPVDHIIGQQRLGSTVALAAARAPLQDKPILTFGQRIEEPSFEKSNLSTCFHTTSE